MFLLAVALLVFTTSLTAQTQSRAERRARVDSVLLQRYYKTPYDTNYVGQLVPCPGHGERCLCEG